MNEKAKTPARRSSLILTIFIIVVLILSLTAVFQAFNMFLNNDPSIWYYLLIGFVGAALSSYMLFQTRRGMAKFSLKTTPIITTLICSKCGFKNIRNFERGDYILKNMGACTNCEGTMVIDAIYREVKEKRKEEKIFA